MIRAPGKHQLALMIWIAVFPTLTVLNLALGGWLRTMSAVPRTFVLATIAVPIVIYGLMPQLHPAPGQAARARRPPRDHLIHLPTPKTMCTPGATRAGRERKAAMT